jgi:hypothetical protein
MNAYTTDTVEFFTLVLTSGMIAVAALAVASLIGFTVAFVLYRERDAASVSVGAMAVPAVEIRPRDVSPATPAYPMQSSAVVAG